MRIATAIVRRSALLHNYEQVKKLCGQKPVMAVLKANAYGHGIVAVAKTLQHADSIGVASIQEAIQLREAKIEQAIILLEGVSHIDELPLIDQHRLDVVVHNNFSLNLLCTYSFTKSLRVWLKVDTGMHRLGFYEDEFKLAYQRLKAVPWLDEMILMTHFSSADDITSAMTTRQVKRFHQLTSAMPERKCLANSAATLAWPESHYDYVRCGLMLFGCSPLLDRCGGDHHLVPAMNFESQVIAVKEIKEGEAIGYGQVWSAKADTKFAVISAGYGDGYPRHAESGTPVWIAGNTYPLVGRVSMDMITVDVGKNSKIKEGDKVILWGKELPVEVIARHAQTIPYQLLCNVTQRVQLTLVDK